jgi:hypothetical protein
VDFLQYLFTERKISVSAIKGYKAAIATSLRLIGSWENVWDDTCTTALKSMSVARPRVKNQTPRWDLSLVLRALMEEPFEPLERASLKFLTLKTVFLVAFATAQRRSEIHASSFEKISFNKERGEVHLVPVPGFMAKNQALNTSRRPVIIPSLSRTVCRDIPDRKLCPVRALKHYVEKTKSPAIRRGREHLFISYAEGNPREIAPATISRWIVTTIKLAYELTGNSRALLNLAKISAHEVRALATSWASFQGVSMDEIMKAVEWKSHSVFSEFYLRDCWVLADGMSTLGPVVAATSVV